MNDNGHQKEPIEGDLACPHCGSDERVLGNFVSEMKEKGILNQDSFPDQCGVWEIPFMELKKFSLIQVPQAVHSFPKVRILFDVCAGCNRLLIVRVEFGEGQIASQQMTSQQMKSPK